jgi:adenylate kinase family enzyme
VKHRESKMERISIVGTSGSGKTTLGKALASVLGIPHVELDALNWLPDWKEREHGDFRERVAEAIRQERWIVDGNYRRNLDLVFARATTVIWLNLPFRIVFKRMLFRIFRRSLTREVLWQGNRETLLRHFVTRDSMLLWVIKTHGKMRSRYRELFRHPDLEHIRKIELKSPREVDIFLRGLNPAIGTGASPADIASPAIPIAPKTTASGPDWAPGGARSH